MWLGIIVSISLMVLLIFIICACVLASVIDDDLVDYYEQEIYLEREIAVCHYNNDAIGEKYYTTKLKLLRERGGRE